MKVKVKLFAAFRDGRFKEQTYDLPESIIIDDILAQLKINLSEVAFLLVNGRYSNSTCVLQDGDTIALIPPIGGG